MNELIKDTMESYNDYLNKITNGSNLIVGHLKSQEIDQALHLIQSFSDGMFWLVEVNQKLKELGFENDLNYQFINEFLIEINNGLEIKDYILVADIFEYEIMPFIKKCLRYEN